MPPKPVIEVRHHRVDVALPDQGERLVGTWHGPHHHRTGVLQPVPHRLNYQVLVLDHEAAAAIKRPGEVGHRSLRKGDQPPAGQPAVLSCVQRA